MIIGDIRFLRATKVAGARLETGSEFSRQYIIHGLHTQYQSVGPLFSSGLPRLATQCKLIRLVGIAHKQSGNSPPFENQDVVGLFNAMADEYDEISDLWYSWLFSRLHYFLSTTLLNGSHAKGRCLDVGCGTGFQSILFNLCGYDSVGIDIAQSLLDKAALKSPIDYLTAEFFRSPFKFAHRYANKIRAVCSACRRSDHPGKSCYQRASATDLPFVNESFEVISCCGSTLNFIHNYEKAIEEMIRVLRPGGILFLEVENKVNPDLVWSRLDPQVSQIEIKSSPVTENHAKAYGHIVINYPFSMKSCDINMQIRLFSARSLLQELRSLGLKLMKLRHIHAITNVIPSVLLDRPNPGRAVKLLFSLLSRVETLVAPWPGLRRLGCSLFIAAQKPMGSLPDTTAN
jgi:ubiquinone/menaquinone biosynthesis C-methylase UbiE